MHGCDAAVQEETQAGAKNGSEKQQVAIIDEREEYSLRLSISFPP
jgi:hypothetical protein